jgi:CelD/BcsL family acetyltransferase involved in cellulose biosynthesis
MLTLEAPLSAPRQSDSHPPAVTPTWHLQRHDDPVGLLGRPEPWDRLGRGNPLRTDAWLAAWWRHFGSDRELYFVGAWDEGGELRGLLPLYRTRSAWGGRVLRALGDGTVCTDHVSVLADENDAPAIALQIGRWLVGQSRSQRDGWEHLDLDGMVGGDTAAQGLLEGLRGGGARCLLTSDMGLWRLKTSASYDDYLGRLSKSHRKKLRRHQNRLEEDAALHLRVIDRAEDVAPRLDELIALHQRRWNAQGLPGSFADPRTVAFIHQAARTFFERDQLRLRLLHRGDRLVAGDLQFQGRDGFLYCYSTAMDPEQGELEPGHLLNIDMLREAHTTAVAGIDLLRGDEPYKARLQAQPRPLIRLRAAAPAIAATARHQLRRAAFACRQTLRRWRGRPPQINGSEITTEEPRKRRREL